jgi:hypothetical protein
MDGARVVGILLLIVGGVILLLGCAVTGYYLVLFDTPVPVYPEIEQYGHHSPRVSNLGLMHQQTVWTIVGISVIVIGLALAIVGLVLCAARRRPVDAGGRGLEGIMSSIGCVWDKLLSVTSGKR